VEPSLSRVRPASDFCVACVDLHHAALAQRGQVDLMVAMAQRRTRAAALQCRAHHLSSQQRVVMVVCHGRKLVELVVAPSL
jgi:hypothetical protein